MPMFAAETLFVIFDIRMVSAYTIVYDDVVTGHREVCPEMGVGVMTPDKED